MTCLRNSARLVASWTLVKYKALTSTVFEYADLFERSRSDAKTAMRLYQDITEAVEKARIRPGGNVKLA